MVFMIVLIRVILYSYVYDLRFFLNLEKEIIVKFSKKEKVLVRIL